MKVTLILVIRVATGRQSNQGIMTEIRIRISHSDDEVVFKMGDFIAHVGIFGEQ